MKKHLLRYLIFWAPAVIVACFFNNMTTVSQALQWFLAFFMLLGWTVTTGMASYHFPNRILSLLLMHLGINMLLIVALYNLNIGSRWTFVMLRLFGLFSFTPLDIIVNALINFNIPHEIYVTVLLFFSCMLGWIAGFIYRKLNPDPYRPHIMK